MGNTGHFSTFNRNSKLFTELEHNTPNWWKMLLEDTELYTEVRKDNYINIYYYGGCIAKISYKKDYKIETHCKYLGLDGKGYKDCHTELSTKEGVERLKRNVREIYLKLTPDFVDKNTKNGILNSSEKYMQGLLISNNRGLYIDSEFAYNATSELDGVRRRIDLVKVESGVVSFVELKKVNDARFTKLAEDNQREIIAQLNKYKTFVEHYSDDILDFYKKMVEVKQSIGIIKEVPTIESVDPNPILHIINNYDRDYKRGKAQRANRIKSIEDIVSDYQVVWTNYHDIK
ncbi:MAG: hypothetical protein SNJ29_14770 [Rikenellaceae bacterium]